MRPLRALYTGLFLACVLAGGVALAQFSKMPVAWKANIRCSYVTLGDGTLELRVCEGYFGAPPCPVGGLVDAPSGSFCHDETYQRIRFKDGRGEWTQ